MLQLLVRQRRIVLPPTTPWCQLVVGVTDAGISKESDSRLFFLSLAAGGIGVHVFPCGR